MPIDVAWYDAEKNIMMMRYEGRWSWEEHYEALQTSKDMMKVLEPQRVDVIAHMVGSFVPRGNMSTHSVSSLRNPSPNLGYVIVVSESRLVTALAAIGLKITATTRQYYRAAPTIAEALDLVAVDRAQKVSDHN